MRSDYSSEHLFWQFIGISFYISINSCCCVDSHWVGCFSLAEPRPTVDVVCVSKLLFEQKCQWILKVIMLWTLHSFCWNWKVMGYNVVRYMPIIRLVIKPYLYYYNQIFSTFIIHINFCLIYTIFSFSQTFQLKLIN